MYLRKCFLSSVTILPVKTQISLWKRINFKILIQRTLVIMTVFVTKDFAVKLNLLL